MGWKMVHKGQVSFLTRIIIIVVSMIAITSILYAFFSSATSDSKVDIACKESYANRASMAKSLGGDWVSLKIKPPITCKTNDVIIPDTEKTQVQKKIAQEMVNCWDIYGRGKYEDDITDQGAYLDVFGLSESHSCIICKVIKLDGLNNNINSVDFSNYLYDNIGTNTGDMTYLKFIQESGGPGRIIMPVRDDRGTLFRNNEAYAIVYSPLSKKSSNTLLSLGAGGALGVGLYFLGPGGWVAGFIGAVSLALAGFGLGFLETNLLGLVFLLISFVLFILDIKAPTHGALTTAGVVSFITGALILFNSPGTPAFSRVSVPLVVTSGVIMGVSFALIVAFAVRSQKAPVRTGQEGMRGRVGRAKTDLNPDGQVQLGGELWSARIEADASPITKDSLIEVIDASGVRLTVRKLD